VGEANRAVLALDHVGVGRRRERVGRNPARSRSDADAVPSAEAKRERVARRRGKPGEPRADELVQRLRDRERPERVDVPVENACQLQRKNGLPPDRSWMRSSVWRAKDLPKRSCRSRWSAPTLSGPTRSRWTRSASSACSSPDRSAPSTSRRASSTRTGLAAKSSQCERERARRGLVEPLHVVDRKQIGCPLAEQLQHVAYGHAERAVIDRILCRLLAEERRPRARGASASRAKRRRPRGRLEQVAQPDVSEAPLGLRRSRQNHAQARSRAAATAREPERRLPDPRLALDHESGRPFDGTVEERRHQAELRLAPDDVAPGIPAIVPPDIGACT
jgi:hypothetical protein